MVALRPWFDVHLERAEILGPAAAELDARDIPATEGGALVQVLAVVP